MYLCICVPVRNIDTLLEQCWVIDIVCGPILMNCISGENVINDEKSVTKITD